MNVEIEIHFSKHLHDGLHNTEIVIMLKDGISVGKVIDLAGHCITEGDVPDKKRISLLSRFTVYYKTFIVTKAT